MSGCGGILASKQNNNPSEPPQTQASANLNIYAVGDVMCHEPQQKSALKADGEYDFTENYVYVKPIIKQADLAICNVEMTFAGAPYSGYPKFSAPDAVAAALKDVGFKIAVTANNHMFDNGAVGLKRTIEVLNDAGLEVAGSVSDENEKKYVLTEVKGVKIAVIAATYESGVFDSSVAINGISISSGNQSLINSFGYKDLEKDLEKYQAIIKQAHDGGAQIVICYFHTGDEYKREPGEFQKEIAASLAAFGADIIFMSHPHVLEKFEMLKLGNKEVPVYYSLGNFISNQREDIMGQRYSEEGIIAQINLTYDFKSQKIAEIHAGYIPTWVDKYYDNQRYTYIIVPLTEDFEHNPAIQESRHSGQAEKALQDINEVLTSSQTTK